MILLHHRFTIELAKMRRLKIIQRVEKNVANSPFKGAIPDG
jgi:hypothetical protein